ncbi:hypothetical protein [Acetobacter oryzoeni]|uniref:Uncharacterized protein n=1 Tax=Acetobacter oryzoeni TaxID=2500548 RepID=A0A5B9GIA5_9PROT|nr:hypothetical protein [Acetobacter oryzoeni]MCP1202297.1 hypothetical protein [Acetobacter oryzoeni]QEE86021.1 hypothetical protein EOV40_010085 [Acetobacter oryzoeni]
MTKPLSIVGYINPPVADALRDPTSGINVTQLRAERNGPVSAPLVLKADADAVIAQLRDALEDAKRFHEEQDKAISKQPPSAQGRWRRHQHQEQIENIEEALKGPEA